MGNDNVNIISGNIDSTDGKESAQTIKYLISDNIFPSSA